MKLNLILFIAVVSFTQLSFAGNDNYPVGAQQAAMANATVMKPNLWSLWHNQAGLGFLTKPSFGLHYENKFIISENGYQAFGLAVPSKFGTVGLAISYFGYKHYNEKKFGLAYSRSFGDKFSFGLQLDYLHTHIDQGYGDKGVALFEAGIMAKPIENLYIGAHVYNPSQVHMNTYPEEEIPTVYRFGIGYSLMENGFISVEYEKDIDFDPRFKAGVEYMAVKNFYLRAGIKSKPVEQTFGIGYVYDNIHADIAFTNNDKLGLTPHFSMLYSF